MTEMDIPITDDFYCDFVLSNKVNVDKIKETDTLLAYFHTKPHWETHIVIIPKEHIVTLSDVTDMNLIAEIFEMAKDIIRNMGLDKTNFRIITNGGSFQDSKHLHFHLVSGEEIV